MKTTRPVRLVALTLVLAACGGGSSDRSTTPAPVAEPVAPAASSTLPECVPPPDELHGFLVVRAADIVVSTTAGELRGFGLAALDEEVQMRVYAGDAGMPWLVLGAPGVTDAAVGAVAERARVGGYTDVRVCTAGPTLTIDVQGAAAWSEAAALSLANANASTAGEDSTDEPADDEPSGGSGYGRGGGFGGGSTALGRIRTGTPRVAGALSVEVVRRVVRRHINEVRFCYERELATTPALEGRLVVSFVVAPSGAVAEVRLVSTALAHERVESCILTALARWTFPAPDDGAAATVTYPLELLRVDTDASEAE